MKLIPTIGNVVIKLPKPEEKTASGIFIPETAQEKAKSRGEVVAVGRGLRLDNGDIEDVEVKKGDQVIYDSYNSSIEIDGEEYLVISQKDIKAIIK